MNVQKPIGPQALSLSGALTVLNFLIVRMNW